MRLNGLGLSSSEAAKKLEEDGYNKLPEVSPPTGTVIFLSQLKSPLVYILLFAGLATFFLGHFTDSVVITIAVIINTVLGYIQESRANKALFALKKLIYPLAQVVRDGKRKKIGVEEVVPGDVCVVNAGDKVPADGILIEANRLFISEAILTGESIPDEKEKGNNAFMGTVVTSGTGLLLVKTTGEDTEIGKIALQVQEPYEDTPLKRQLLRFSRQLTVLVIILNVFIFFIGIMSRRDLIEIFTTSVALAVSSIPEGLLVGLTVVLAIGMQRILKQKGLVRNLVSAETLGGVTTICVDKTGTLTEGKMQVVDYLGERVDIAKQAIIANDLDDPIVIALWEWSQKKLSSKDLRGESVDEYLDSHPRIDSIPFSSKERFFATLNKVSNGKNILFVNGAPEFLLEWSDLSNKEKEKITTEIERLTGEGKRLVGMAKKEVAGRVKKIAESDIKKDLTWVGIVAFSDPVRVGVKESLEKTKSANVKLIVITGDYAQTAVSIMNQLSIQVSEENIIIGSELEHMSTESLRKSLNGSHMKLFARTTPQQKLKIVEALKENGEVVAMMGDGVNDAPALKRADIGIVVGDATDVAKESADLVLLDSSFATIVSAIEEGRGIFDNIRKIVLYLMSDAFEEIVAVVGTILLGLPLPVTAAQILWINLVSDEFPHLALTVDPRDIQVMKNPPRNPEESLVAGWMKRLITIVSLSGGFVGIGLFVYFFNLTQNEALARSIAFAALGINSLIYVFSVRTLREPFWRENPFANKWLNVAVIAGIFLQVVPFLFPLTREFLDLEKLNINHWIVIFSAGITMFIIIEGSKFFFRKQLDDLTHQV